MYDSVSKSYYGAKNLPLYYETTKEFTNRSRSNKTEQQPTSKELHHK
jgi:hypothetical protein